MEKELKKPTAETTPDEKHVVKMWTPFHIKVDETYKFIPENKAFIRFSNGFKSIAVPLLKAFNKLVFNLKIEGRENLEPLRGKGYITVCNHVNLMDCGMITTAIGRSDMIFTTIPENFEIPVVRHLVKALGGIPIPRGVKALEKFSEAVGTMLQQGKVVHFYPEAVLVPRYNGLRGFRRGAFSYAAKYDAPIVPMVITFSNDHKGLHRKPTPTIHVLPPVYPDMTLSERERSNQIKKDVFDCMEAKFEQTDCLKDNTAVIEKYGLNENK